jgi:hypothetical protein
MTEHTIIWSRGGVRTCDRLLRLAYGRLLRKILAGRQAAG